MNKAPMGYFPNVTEKVEGHLVSSNVLDILTKNRIIILYDEINAATATPIIAQLLYHDSTDPTKEISLYINSPGGEVDSGLAIYDTMQLIKAPVRTIAVGLAASMGAMILSGGTPGMRCALPHANIMIHQPLGGARGQQTEIEIAAKHIKQCRETLEGLLIERSNGKLHAGNIKENTERDNYLTPEMALELGVIDKIITPEKKIFTPN